MALRRITRVAFFSLLSAFICSCAPPAAAQSQVLTRELHSQNFGHTSIGTSPIRKMTVYLPAGYGASTTRYPVIYFLPYASDGYRGTFEQRHAQALFDQAIAEHVIRDFILVCVDMNTPVGYSWSVNSSVTGNWEDFVVKELVPDIDANFRTLANRDSRGIAGDRTGGYGAIRFGMRYPDVFGAVYALHPVGTGSGVQIMYTRPNWDLMARVKSIDELRADPFSMVFTSIFQAHLPNPDKPPLFFDVPAHKVGDQLVIDSVLTERLHNNFFLEVQIPKYAENLKTLRGFKFDWGRSDGIHDHVYANQSFTHKLDEFGIPHEAEEYRGGFGDRVWGEDGRVYTDLLPFFQKHLVFAAGATK